jgi:hypothetical protein
MTQSATNFGSPMCAVMALEVLDCCELPTISAVAHDNSRNRAELLRRHSRCSLAMQQFVLASGA